MNKKYLLTLCLLIFLTKSAFAHGFSGPEILLILGMYLWKYMVLFGIVTIIVLFCKKSKRGFVKPVIISVAFFIIFGYAIYKDMTRYDDVTRNDKHILSIDDQIDEGKTYIRIESARDKDLEELKDYISLQELNLSHSRVTGIGLQYVIDCKNLTALNLMFGELNDEGTVYISRLVNLEKLELDGTKITNASVQNLSKLKNLKNLSLRYSQIDMQGYEELVKNLPNCVITFIDRKTEKKYPVPVLPKN